MKLPKTIRTSSFFVRSNSPRTGRWVLGALLALCAATGPTSKADSAPDWLVAASRADIGHLGDGYSTVIVQQSTDFAVDATGKFTCTERVALRVLNRQSADRFLSHSGYENGDSSVVSIKSWTISPTGKVMQSDKKSVVTAGDFADFELFSDSRRKVVQAPGAEEGSLVGFEVITQGHIPINGERFPLESEIPIRSAELNVSVPSGSLRWFANHPDRLEVVSQSATAATFRTTDRPAIPDEEDAPPFDSLASEIVINYDAKGSAPIQSWEDAGRAYHPLFSTAEKPTTDIQTGVQGLTADKNDQLSKLDALYSFVSQKIRYVAIEIGIGGYQPHPAPDVYKYKYGDCKDKATLLLTMMDEIGLRGDIVLVGTKGDIEADPKVPTLATFDHAIVALPVPESLRPAVEHFPAYDPQTKILWIDPTSETDPLGQLPQMDQGVYSLISYPDHGDLRRIPESPPEANGVEYTVQLQLQNSGIGTADVHRRYVGVSNSSRHYFYRNRSETKIRTTFERLVSRYVSQSAFRESSVAGKDDNHQQIVEQFSFDGNFAIASSGDS